VGAHLDRLEQLEDFDFVPELDDSANHDLFPDQTDVWDDDEWMDWTMADEWASTFESFDSKLLKQASGEWQPPVDWHAKYERARDEFNTLYQEILEANADALNATMSRSNERFGVHGRVILDQAHNVARRFEIIASTDDEG
jgi:hypothetical protein